MSCRQAELTGSDFDIIADGQPQRYVLSQGGAGWAWTVRPRSLGKHALLLQIGIPVVIDQAKELLGVQALRNIPIEVQVVSAPPTATTAPTPTLVPTATSTPLPALTRISEKLIENSQLVVVAIIGLVGTLATLYANSRVKDRDRKIAELEKQLAQGTSEKETLRQEVTRLKSIPRWQFWRK